MNIRRSNIGFFTFLLTLCVSVTTSCSKDEDKKLAAPKIEFVHLGTHESPDDRIIYIGESIHFEANIVAPAAIQKIDIEIKQKSGYSDYTFTKEYKESYVGQTEIKGFHDHPEIPNGKPIGDYVFTVKVTDQAGQVGIISSDIKVKANRGSEPGHEHEH